MTSVFSIRGIDRQSIGRRRDTNHIDQLERRHNSRGQAAEIYHHLAKAGYDHGTSTQHGSADANINQNTGAIGL